jgi:FixJ family two-component response regulator
LNNLVRRIYLVDDDPAVLKGICRLLRSFGYETEAFTSAQMFIQQYHPDTRGCLVLDVAMPGTTGPELQHWLMQSRSPLPIIFLTGQGDVPTSVRAMKEGAVDFLMKPVNDVDLLAAIDRALQLESESRAEWANTEMIQARLSTLTPREREVLEHVVSGELNKQIAADLGTVEKTIKVHRARVMEKMGVRSLAELARLAERAGIGSVPLPKPLSPSRLPPSA